MDAATNTVTQGRNIGTVLFSYIPMSLAVSVITVLCLGMSANSQGAQPQTHRKKHSADPNASTNQADTSTSSTGTSTSSAAATVNSAAIANSGYGSDPLPLAPTPAMESGSSSMQYSQASDAYSQPAQTASSPIGVPTPQLVG